MDDSLYLQPVGVDDMKGLKPFEDASNHTTVVLFEKTADQPQYPVSYRTWSPRTGQKKAIKASMPLDTVLSKIQFTQKEAFPVEDDGSPWAILEPRRFNAIKYLSMQCTWTQGRKGITTDLNGVYFVPILQDNGNLVQVQSRPQAGRKDIGSQKKVWVEPDLLYPLIKGAGDFEECYLKLTAPDYTEQRLYTFIPNIGISNAEYEAARSALHSPTLKKTAAWFRLYEPILSQRSTYRRQMKGAPYYAIYNIGEYTFKPWKVIWPEMSSSFYAAVAGCTEVPVVGTRTYIPDHKIYFASFDHKETAYFLCGLLNSPTVQEWIEAHNVSIQIADIFKHLSLPEFDLKNNDHLTLAQFIEAAHNEHDKNKRRQIISKAKNLAEAILTIWSETLK